MADDQNKQEQQTDETKYTVTIEGPGVRVEQQVPKALLPQLMAMLINVHIPTATAALTQRSVVSGATSRLTESSDRPLSLMEYLEDINARRIPERILGMANYLTEVTRQSPGGTFAKADIRPCFKAAGDPMPANFSRDWQLVVQAGWVAQESGDGDLYFVTRRGKTAISEKFSGQVDRIARIRKRWRNASGGISTETEPDSDKNEESAS